MAKIAILLADDFEDSEFAVPYQRLRDAGHDVTVVGTKAGARLSGKRGREQVAVELSTADADPESFDVLVIPGGYSPDHLRTDEHAVRLVREMFNRNKLVAAICHAGWLLAEADVVRGHRLTSWPSIRTDLVNAGATWVDGVVVEDGNLITSRKPDDLDAFSQTILKRIEEPLVTPRN